MFLKTEEQAFCMRIRAARIQDIDSIIPVVMDYEKASESYLADKYKSMRDKKKPLKKHIKLAFEKDIQKKNAKFLVIEDGNKIIGYIFGEVRDDSHPLYKRPKTGELNDIAVLNKYQGKGVASRLWKELQKWFIRKKCRMVTLSVNSNNKAREIYKRWGFDVFYLRMIKKI